MGISLLDKVLFSYDSKTAAVPWTRGDLAPFVFYFKRISASRRNFWQHFRAVVPFWLTNRSAVDMGQVEGEGATVEVGTVVVGRMPFAAEVAAVSGDVPFVPDGGAGGAVHDGHFCAEIGVSHGCEVEGNPPVVDSAAKAPAGVRFRGGEGRDAQFAGNGPVLVFLQGQNPGAGSAARSAYRASVGVFRHNGGARDRCEHQQRCRENVNVVCLHRCRVKAEVKNQGWRWRLFLLGFWGYIDGIGVVIQVAQRGF